MLLVVLLGATEWKNKYMYMFVYLLIYLSIYDEAPPMNVFLLESTWLFLQTIITPTSWKNIAIVICQYTWSSVHF